MATKNIAAILSLKDQMTPKLINIQKHMQGITKDQSRAVASLNNLANNTLSKFHKMTQAVQRYSLMMAGLGLGFAFKAGFERAKELEAIRISLSTVIKEEEKLASVTKLVNDLAVKTPYEAPELSKAAITLAQFRLENEKWLSTVGDTTAVIGNGRDAGEVALAVAKAAQGQYARMIQMGVTRELVQAHMLEKGIRDEVEGLYSFLNSNYGGAMDKLSKTFAGRWSTLTDNFKFAMAKILGVQEDGTVRIGSAYDRIMGFVDKLINKLAEMEANGSLKDWETTLGNIVGVLSKIIGFAADFPAFTTTIIGLAIAFNGLMSAINTVKAAQQAYNTIKAVVIGLKTKEIILDKQHLVTQNLSILAGLKEIMVSKNISIWKRIGMALEFLYQNLIKSNPYVAILGVAGGLLAATAIISNIKKELPDPNKTGANATGTGYWRGGRSLVGEHGPEVVDLPSGSKVYSASKSAKMQNGISNYINIYITGAKKSDDEIANIVAKRLVEVMGNI